MSIIKKLKKLNLLTAQQDFICETSYEVIMGSAAYGVSNIDSDIDVYAVSVPPLEMIFPHTVGYIKGFGPAPENFDNFQQHHINSNEKEYDINIFSIIKYFDLCADNNPNALDSLFVPERCILHIDNVGRILRANKKLFLHKGAFHRFKGYAYSQFKKLETKKPEGKRKEIIEKYGVDVKFMYHIFRLNEQCEQILVEHDMDLERCKELLKAVRRGEYTLEQAREWFNAKEKILNQLYIDSTLQHSPNYADLKRVLLTCIEEKHGAVDTYLNMSADVNVLKKYEQIKQIINGD